MQRRRLFGVKENEAMRGNTPAGPRPKPKDAALFEPSIERTFSRFRVTFLRRLPLDSRDDIVATAFVVAWEKLDSNLEPVPSVAVSHRQFLRSPMNFVAWPSTEDRIGSGL